MTVPYNQDAERAVLGSILVNPDALYDITDLVSPKDFYEKKHEIIFETMIEMFSAGEKIDIVVLIDRLTAKGHIEIISRSYITSLYGDILSSSQIKKHALIVKDKAIRRELIAAQQRNMPVILDEEKSIDSVLAETQSSIYKINTLKQQDDTAVAILSELEQVQKEYAETYKKGRQYIGIPTGIEKIDRNIDGLRPGHVWVIGAWTSTGKTQFALNIVHNVLAQLEPVSIVSLEMSRIDTIARLIGIRHNLSSAAVLKQQLNGSERKKIEEGKAFLQVVPLEVHTTYFELEKIKMLIRRDVYRRNVKLVVIDYVQNIMSEKAMKEYELVTKAAVDLQALARDLGITICIISQISNESQKGQGAGAGFKGSGALEAVADLAIRLERDRAKEGPDDEFVPVKIKISKNRHGFTGTIEDYYMWLKSGKFEAGLFYVPYEARIAAQNPKV